MNGEINFEFVKDKDWDVVTGQSFLVPIQKDKQSLVLVPSECEVLVMVMTIILGILQLPVLIQSMPMLNQLKNAFVMSSGSQSGGTGEVCTYLVDVVCSQR